MRRKLLLFGLITAALPAVGSAQEAKLVNCRTLEAAGNFVGPDEVIVDDMVCQKVKPGAPAAAKPQPEKPLQGAVISDTSVDNVVDAAKAAGKRIAIRKEAEAEKNAIAAATPASAPAAESAEPSAPPAKTVEAAVGPSANPAPAPVTSSAPATAAPAPPSQPIASTPPPTAKVEVTSVPAEPAPQFAASPATPPAPTPAPEAAAKSEPPAPTEIVLSSAPASAPPAENKAEVPPAEVPAPPPTPAVPAPPADPTHPATSGGFYDANAPKASANSAPQTNTGFASAEQVNAGLKPGATSIEPPAQAVAAEPDPAPASTAIAASRVPFDDPNADRSVKLGDFAQPKDVASDPNVEHRSSVDASADDGFQDRQRPECTKNITLGGLRGEKLVLGVPGWAARWIDKNEKRMPAICFSETPMKSARNYLIVFSTPGGATSKDIADLAVNPTKVGSAAGVGAFSTNFGSTWHYSVDRNVGTTILTQDDADEPHGSPGQVLYATAYTEEGVPVSQRWPSQPKKEFNKAEKNPKKAKDEMEALERVSSDLLSQMVEDIQKF
jgi:hypothetical protein